MSKRQEIFETVKEILKESPEGLRYSEIIRKLQEKFKDTPTNTLHGSTWEFRQKILDESEKDVMIPEKGLYILTKYYKKNTRSNMLQLKVKEEDFYEPFANYLVNALEECTNAISLGGNKFGDKWGTPDVFGIYKFSEADPIKPPVEIITAEVKLDTNQLITAFGQACAYKLFSHKVYLVIPKEAEQEIARIESLCMRFGIGLILFNRNDRENPDFEIRTRASKNEPDYYYVNKYIGQLDEVSKRKLFR
jgi:hypothetical protein